MGVVQERRERILMKSYRNKGISLMILEDFQEGIEFLDKALEIAPNDYIALYNKAFALGELGDTKESITYYDKAIEVIENEKYEEEIHKKIENGECTILEFDTLLSSKSSISSWLGKQ